MSMTHPRQEKAEMAVVAAKAFSRIADEWKLSIEEAAAIAEVSTSTWKRAKAGTAFEMTQDQLLRMSALVGIYKALNIYFDKPLASDWITRPNTGPLFQGKRPVDAMLEGGLPTFLTVRNYLDALRGGA
jgi:uncharacterized protein (DUF2384 family)